MKTKTPNPTIPRTGRWIGLLLVVCALLVPGQANASGTWTNVVQAPPNNNAVQLIVLLSDGTVMAQQAGTSRNWYRLTPVNGSYINGYWTTLTPMNDPRQYYSSAVLQDGRVFVAGGEYDAGGQFGTAGGARAEVYDPVADRWTQINPPTSLLDPTQPSPVNPSLYNQAFADSGCVILPNGNVLIAPVLYKVPNQTIIYNPTANSWSAGPATLGYQDEATWVKLPDDSILTIDPIQDPNGNTLNTSERFIPALNNGQGGWTNDANTTVAMYNFAQEIGPGLLLPDGRAWFMGGVGHTAFYTPSGNNNPGSWTACPDLPSPNVGWDNPGAMLVTGKVLIPVANSLNPTTFKYLEFDPNANPLTTANAFTPAGDYWGDTSGISHIMLNLPDGTVLLSNGTSTLHIYRPDGNPISSGKPTISNIKVNADGSYHLTGTKLNGISQGSSFGDDAQMDSNYPLVRLTDGTGHTNYARTYNWSSTSVQTGNTPVTTEFSLPSAIQIPGSYSLVVVANGIASDPVPFSGLVWVAFGLPDPGIGTYDRPYNTLARGRDNVSVGGTIFIKPGSTPETITLSKRMTITAVGGSATVGR
jgi:hypothetical protein